MMRTHLTTFILTLLFSATATGCAQMAHVLEEAPRAQLMWFDEADTVDADELVTEYIFDGDELIVDAPAEEQVPAT
ncbi:MAG: hypothetical protein ACPGU1_20510 [Myxococcota bacterium]